MRSQGIVKVDAGRDGGEFSLETPRFSISKADERTLTVLYTAEGSAPCSPDVVHTLKLLEGASPSAAKIFSQMSEMAVKATTKKDGNPFQVIQTSLSKLGDSVDREFISEHVISPTLGGMALIPESPYPSFLTSVSKGERAKDKLTGLLPPAFLLDERILSTVFREMGADCSIVSMDIQGLGALNEVGLGDEIDEFLKTLQTLIGEHFKGNGKVWITREGGDEFLFMVPLCSEGSANKDQKAKFEETLKDFSKRVREAVNGHFSGVDPNLMETAEKIRIARLGSNSDHEALGVMLPYISARFIPFREDMKGSELQTLFVKCRDENDKAIFDLKRKVKGGDTTSLDGMCQLQEADPNFWLKKEERQALQRLAMRSERSASHFLNASEAKDSYVRSYHRHMARMFASIEPLISEPCFRINRAEDAKLGEFMGFTKPCNLNVLVIDIEKFGKWNTLLGSLGADTKVLSDIVLSELRGNLPHSIRFRERGGRLIIATRNPLDTSVVRTTATKIEEQLKSLFERAVSDFNERAKERGEKSWSEILEDDLRFEREKGKILKEAGITKKQLGDSQQKNPGSISVKGFSFEIDPYCDLGNFAKKVSILEGDAAERNMV